MNYEEKNIPKYLKKRKSSISKSKEKSKHKHEYTDCLLIEDYGKPYKAVYCTLCGKIRSVQFCETERTDNGTYRTIDPEEVIKKHRNLPQIHIKDIFQKYISIDTEDNTLTPL